MDAAFMYHHRSSEKSSISPYKSHMIKNPQNIQMNPFFHDNFVGNYSMGILQTPVPQFPFRSYPPIFPNQQPPLLPLPAATRTVSCPPANKKMTSYKNKNFTPPKKSIPSTKDHPRKEKKNSPKKSQDLGNNSKNPTKNIVKKAMPFISSGYIVSNTNDVKSEVQNDPCDKFSGSHVMLDISPPPSSLPLPTFFMRKKSSCNIEAAATDNLRRILRLR